MVGRPELRTALLGRNPSRTLLALGLAVGLGLSVHDAIARSPEWLEAMDGRLYVPVLFVVVVGGAIAAWNASRNDGIVPSWLLVFAPVLGWLWHVFVQGPVNVERAIVPTAFATLAALVVGTVGYVVGRRIDARAASDARDESSDWLLRLLVGRVPARFSRWGLRAGGLFVLASALVYATRPYLRLPIEGVVLFDLYYPTGALAAAVLGGVVVLAWTGLAAWPAYRRAGLLASWAITFGPLFGAILTDFLLGGTSGGGPVIDATLAFLAALSFALVLGTGGFLVGAATRRVAAGVAPSGVRILG